MTAAHGLSELGVVATDFAPGRAVMLHCGGLCVGWLFMGRSLSQAQSWTSRSQLVHPLSSPRSTKAVKHSFLSSEEIGITPPDVLSGSECADSLDSVILAPWLPTCSSASGGGVL
eukprot:7333397-Pyramimonas_sp.AAC.1